MVFGCLESAAKEGRGGVAQIRDKDWPGDDDRSWRSSSFNFFFFFFVIFLCISASGGCGMCHAGCGMAP